MEAVSSLFYKYFISGAIDIYGGTWGGDECHGYVDPSTTVKEGLLWTSLSLLGVYIWLPKLILKQTTPLNNGRSGWIDTVLGVIHIILLLYLVWVKLSTYTGLYMLQPCHLHLLLEAVWLFSKPTTQTTRYVQGHMIFMMGAIMAMALPDTDLLTKPLEVEFYWVEHIMIAFVTPLRLLYVHNDGTFGFGPMLAAIALFELFHWPILLFVDLVTKVNLQFLLCPTVGMAGLFRTMPDEFHDNFLSYRSLVSVVWTPSCVLFGVLYLVFAWLLFRSKSIKVN
eukprot:m.250962 g.250962  ORF g.250962 m.250962 type:complete len:281 (-) comp17516_c1_seq68:3242-4084(-)